MPLDSATTGGTVHPVAANVRSLQEYPLDATSVVGVATPFSNKPIQLGRKRKLLADILGMLAVALNGWRWLRERLAPSAPKPVVFLLEPFAMGDIVSLEPLVRILAEMGYLVRLCSKAHWRPLIRAANLDRWLNEHIPWTSYDSGQKYRLKFFLSRAWWHFFGDLRRCCQGVIGVDCRGDIRSVLLLHLGGCRQVLTLSHYLGSDLKMTAWAATQIVDDGTQRRWELNLGFARAMGVKVQTQVAPPDLRHLLTPAPIPPRESETPSKPNAGLPTVGLVAVAPWPGRLWSAAKWQTLVTQLRSLGLHPVGFHGPGQVAAARAALGAEVELIQADSVADWAAKLTQVNIVVSLDSGPMHLADALGIPVIGLFGSGKLPLWAPSGKFSRALHHQDRPGFYPCHQIDQNIELGQSYLDWIQVEEVMAAVQEIIKRS